MKISEWLRIQIKSEPSVLIVAKETGISQASLHEFVFGRPDGSTSDLRLSSAEKLISRYAPDLKLSKKTRKKTLQKNGVRKMVKRMTLKRELRESNCDCSPEKFREQLLDTLVNEFQAMTIDDLVCSPDTALEFCDHIREGFGSENLSSMVILKALINIRKSKKCPKELNPRVTRTSVQQQLTDAGCELSADEFRELLVDCLAGMYRDFTIDELVCLPKAARDYISVIRQKAKCKNLPDKFILKTLMNCRKSVVRSS